MNRRNSEFEQKVTKGTKMNGLFARALLLLPLPVTKERGEGRGEGRFSKATDGKSAPGFGITLLLSPALSSIPWRRGSLLASSSRTVTKRAYMVHQLNPLRSLRFLLLKNSPQ
jgi:hypothetical protein